MCSHYGTPRQGAPLRGCTCICTHVCPRQRMGASARPRISAASNGWMDASMHACVHARRPVSGDACLPACQHACEASRAREGICLSHNVPVHICICTRMRMRMRECMRMQEGMRICICENACENACVYAYMRMYSFAVSSASAEHKNNHCNNNDNNAFANTNSDAHTD